MAQLKLPSSIATKTELVAVLRNVEEVLDAYIENGIRQDEGVDFAQRPDVSSNLAQIVSENKLEVTVDTLKSLKHWLTHLKDHAPVVRFTFASDPNPDFLSKLITWLRHESGSFVLMRYGVQPAIAAGCLMYTPARRYDFSLRRSLMASGKIFSEVLSRVEAPPQPAEAKTEAPATAPESANPETEQKIEVKRQ